MILWVTLDMWYKEWNIELNEDLLGHGSFVFWGHHFRGTVIASSCRFMISNECIKGEDNE